MRPQEAVILKIPGSSVVEQLAVNQLAVGSNPTPGAILSFLKDSAVHQTVHASHRRAFRFLAVGSKLQD